MNLIGIHHEPKSQYAYACDSKTVHLTLRTVKDDVAKVTLLWGDPFDWSPKLEEHSKVEQGSRIEEGAQEKITEWIWQRGQAFEQICTKAYSDGLYDYWFARIQPEWKRARYGFLLQDHLETQEIIFGARGFFDLVSKPEKRYAIGDYFNFPYINQEDVFAVPEWVQDTVWYQIFPERFANGDPALNRPGTLPWGKHQTVSNDMLFGGDLQGIIDHLGYIADLGITGIYFTPIFEATSTHKYDTIDYYKIDPAFGTNETFKELVEKAHALGIRIMLDAVFNHCGFKHPFFQDVLQKGRASKYYDWFHILQDPVVNFPIKDGYPKPHSHQLAGKLNYETFAFTPMMPKWRTGNPDCEAYLLDIGRYWIENYHIDGWRLDVSNEVSHDFWRKFRTVVKTADPNCFILGENWDDATPWLRADQFDGVMNYEWTTPIWRLLAAPSQVDSSYSLCEFENAVSRLMATTPSTIARTMFNLIDSHDTSRVLTLMGGSIPKVKIAFLLQMIFAGSPSVYYGSEQGLTGIGDGNRQCMVWDENQGNQSLHQHVKRLIAIRHQEPLTKVIDLEFQNWSGDEAPLVIIKKAQNQQLIILVNLSEKENCIDIPVEMVGPVDDLYHQDKLHLTEKHTLEPHGFLLLKKV